MVGYAALPALLTGNIPRIGKKTDTYDMKKALMEIVIHKCFGFVAAGYPSKKSKASIRQKPASNV